MFKFQAEELIKKEMLSMLYHDAVAHTATNQVSAIRNYTTAVEKYPYEDIPEDDIASVSVLITRS